MGDCFDLELLELCCGASVYKAIILSKLCTTVITVELGEYHFANL